MSNYVLFQMWKPFRQSLIKEHSFYVEQARKRLLSQFSDIEAEADRAAEEWLAQHSQKFNPEYDDAGDFYEWANDVQIEFYGLLEEMREQTRLSVVAGMFHTWDKKLRDWLVREIHHWHRGNNATAKLWSADFTQIVELLEGFGWNIRTSNYFPTLDACRLVVNVYKHGDGKSLDALRDHFPEYLDDPFKGMGCLFSDTKLRDHTHLKVSDDQFQAFSDAILEFWRNVPENTSESQLTAFPDWFEKAILKDEAELQQKG